MATFSALPSCCAPLFTPQRGCLVRRRNPLSRDEGFYHVVNVESAPHEPEAGAWLEVQKSPKSPTFKLRQSEVTCGFHFGHHVRMHSTGAQGDKVSGEVTGLAEVGKQTLVFVRRFDNGEVVSLPYELLQQMPHPYQRYMSSLGTPRPRQTGDNHPGPAEAMRLRVLAHALERWNENTGALSRLDIDPLPHQMQLVDEILRSGNLNWMIADDVGLGKTIEVGMLLSALLMRQPNMRVMIVTPSGLTRQWQEELAEKFNMHGFRIYGDDFQIRNNPRHWEEHARVIISMDRAKHEKHLPSLMQSGSWDMIIFDEAHRLTRREYGRHHRSSQRFDLAQHLRQITPAMLLLTATPHQGRTDQFRALLELLRPEHRNAFNALEQHPELLGEMIYRNRKSQVTDAEGERIFHGQETRLCEFRMSPEELAFDELLQDYFQRCADQARQTGGMLGRSIGFVLTTFRKLAASSHAAIYRALTRRLHTLQSAQRALLETRARIQVQDYPEDLRAILDPEDEENAGDSRFAGEHDEEMVRKIEDYLTTQRAQSSFFDGEERELESLIALLEPLLTEDSKMDTFLEQIFDVIRTRESGSKKLLIFTEFRATQQHLHEALSQRMGSTPIGLIHGGMKMVERLDVVRRFGADLQEQDTPLEVIISTEAGGEGLNMHEDCNVMVNYDLPWNPMRIVQRIGRLYRYGQQKRVVVFNLHSRDTLDQNVVARLHQRINSVVEDLSGWSEDYGEQLHEEILGELVELMDSEGISKILEDALLTPKEAMEERLDDIVEQAKQDYKMQSELMKFARHFDPEREQRGLHLRHEHLDTFIESVLMALGCRIIERQHEGRVWRVLLSDRVADAISKQRGSSLRITTHRRTRRKLGKDVRIMDFEDPLFLLLIAYAKQEQFEGYVAPLDLTNSTLHGEELLLFARAMWQDRHGKKMREEIIALSMNTRTAVVRINEADHGDWLAQRARDDRSPQRQASPELQAQRKHLATGVREALDTYIREQSTRMQLPMFSYPLAFGIGRI